MTAWQEYRVADLADPSSFALATGPFGSAISSKYFVDDGIPVLRGSNLSLDVGVRLKDEGLAFLPEEMAIAFRRSIARRGDLVFTCWGTVGQIGLVDSRAKYSEYVVSNKQMKLTPDAERVDSLFLYYLLSSPEMVQTVRDQAIGAAVPGFNLGQLRELRVRMPSIDRQRTIANLLGALDELIENNWRRVEVLEDMARVIYREWFVRFQYPGHEDATFIDSPLGPIPGDWNVTLLGDVLELKYGKALTKGQRNGGSVAVLGSSGVVGWHDEELIPGPAVIVGRKGNVGSIIWVDGSSWPIDTTYYVVTDLPLRYVVEQLRRTEFLNTHAAIPGLSRDQAYSKPFLLPSAGVVDQFTAVSENLASEASALTAQSERLASIRDLLLPDLVTGKLDVSSLDLDSSVLVKGAVG